MSAHRRSLYLTGAYFMVRRGHRHDPRTPGRWLRAECAPTIERSVAR